MTSLQGKQPALFETKESIDYEPTLYYVEGYDL